MKSSSRDRLINTGVGNVYFQLVLLFMTLTGVMYVTNALPAYDPSILALPLWLSKTEYFIVAITGIITFISFFFRDKIVGLKVQFYGLLFHAIAILTTAFSALAYAGLKSIFILMVGIVFGSMHIVRLFFLRREIANAPLKRRIGEEVPLPDESEESVTGVPEAKGDLVLQTLLLLQNRNESLNRQLKKA